MVLQLSLLVDLDDDGVDPATIDVQLGAIARKLASGQRIGVACEGVDFMLSLSSLTMGTVSPASASKDKDKKRSSWFKRRSTGASASARGAKGVTN